MSNTLHELPQDLLSLFWDDGMGFTVGYRGEIIKILFQARINKISLIEWVTKKK